MEHVVKIHKSVSQNCIISALSAFLKVIFIIHLQHKEKWKQAQFLWVILQTGSAFKLPITSLHSGFLHDLPPYSLPKSYFPSALRPNSKLLFPQRL